MTAAANARRSSPPDEPAAMAVGGGQQAAPEGLGAAIGAVVGGYRDAAAAITDLAVAESGLAVASLVRITKVAALFALFVTTGWLLAALAFAALTAPALGWPAALGALAGANFLLALLCLLWIARLQPRLGFPVLRTALAEMRRRDEASTDNATPS